MNVSTFSQSLDARATWYSAGMGTGWVPPDSGWTALINPRLSVMKRFIVLSTFLSHRLDCLSRSSLEGLIESYTERPA